MSLEGLKLVYEEEEKARLAREAAQQIAQDAVNETQMECDEIVASTLARADSEIAHLIRLSDKKATQQAAELASATANRQATLRARAERRLDTAASLIVERIVNR